MFPPDAAPVTRRLLLVGAVGVPLLLSTSSCTADAPVALPVDPEREALESARKVEAATLLSLEGWPAGQDAGTVSPVDARAVIVAHLDALDKALGSAPTTTPTPSGSGSGEPVRTVSTAQVVMALDSAADDHTHALRTASPGISPLLASIAASDAVLAAAIRRAS